jgi:hypothetical protein
MQVVLELFWLRVGTKLMATTVPTTSLVFAQPPYLRQHSDKFVTCIAFAWTFSPTTFLLSTPDIVLPNGDDLFDEK